MGSNAPLRSVVRFSLPPSLDIECKHYTLRSVIHLCQKLEAPFTRAAPSGRLGGDDLATHDTPQRIDAELLVDRALLRQRGRRKRDPASSGSRSDAGAR